MMAGLAGHRCRSETKTIRSEILSLKLRLVGGWIPRRRKPGWTVQHEGHRASYPQTDSRSPTNKCFPPGWAPGLGLLGSGLARLGFQGSTQGHIRASPTSSLEGTHELQETEVSEQEQSQLATMECQGDCPASFRPP